MSEGTICVAMERREGQGGVLVDLDRLPALLFDGLRLFAERTMSFALEKKNNREERKERKKSRTHSLDSLGRRSPAQSFAGGLLLRVLPPTSTLRPAPALSSSNSCSSAHRATSPSWTPHPSCFALALAASGHPFVRRRRRSPASHLVPSAAVALAIS